MKTVCRGISKCRWAGFTSSPALNKLHKMYSNAEWCLRHVLFPPFMYDLCVCIRDLLAVTAWDGIAAEFMRQACSIMGQVRWTKTGAHFQKSMSLAEYSYFYNCGNLAMSFLLVEPQTILNCDEPQTWLWYVCNLEYDSWLHQYESRQLITSRLMSLLWRWQWQPAPPPYHRCSNWWLWWSEIPRTSWCVSSYLWS
jgi:hypothetical protein